MALAVACDRSAPPPSAPPLPPPNSATITPPVVPALLSPADVDRQLYAEWQKAGAAPTPAADDATWLRRAWIDALGTIPPPEAVVAFLADASAGKRMRAIDAILSSPAWADHWTAYWDDVWMGRDVRGPDVDRGAFRSWLHESFARNAPWNEVVTELLTATGANSDGRPRREAEAAEGGEPTPPGVRGAVNWTLKYVETPQDMAGAAARTLLGVQIQCAQCHDHKTEKWTQKDFQAFAAAFVRTRPVPIDTGPRMGLIRRVEVRDLDRPAPRFAKMGDLDAISKTPPATLDGASLDGQAVRATLARWVVAPQNSWFARAFVNRMWAHFLGRGFVDPMDDLRPSNPPSASDLWSELSADFVASGYDVKHLVRLIVSSAAYARSCGALDEATATVDPGAKLWERFRMTPLGPDELLGALTAATKLDAVVRATGRMDLAEVRRVIRARYGFLFDVDEESDVRDYEGTIAQALALLNGSVVATGASGLPESALHDLLADGPSAPRAIEGLYLRTLSRFPTAQETASWITFIEDARDASNAGVEAGAVRESGLDAPAARDGGAAKAAATRPVQPDPLRGLEGRAASRHEDAGARAYEDVLWALLNSSEFVFNH
jgi:hypothetical protein